MIITYPVRIPYTLGSQQRVVPDAIYNNSEILSGSFPMEKNRFWHGGLHLHPTDRETPIRAIADGELVAYRYDVTDATDAFFDKVPYSRSFVLLKHETELGMINAALVAASAAFGREAKHCGAAAQGPPWGYNLIFEKVLLSEKYLSVVFDKSTVCAGSPDIEKEARVFSLPTGNLVHPRPYSSKSSQQRNWPPAYRWTVN